jgi:hypothetical protein
MNESVDREVTEAIKTAIDPETERRKPFASFGRPTAFRPQEQTDDAQIIPHPSAKEAKFREVGGAMMFIGYAYLDHMTQFRAAYKKQTLQVREKMTEVYTVALQEMDRVTNERHTRTASFASADEAENYIVASYATVSVPYMMYELLGTEVATNDGMLHKLEMEFVNSDFGD